MTLVRILRQPTGFRDGVEWPAVGDTLDVPAAEADDLERIGIAERVAVPAKAAPEKATAPAAETAATPKPRTRKA